MMNAKSVSGSRRTTVRGSVAAGFVGGAVLASAAGIEVARAWTRPGAESTHVVGGVLVALLVCAAGGLAVQARSLASLAVASAFGLFTHGAVLALQGDVIGALFLGLAPIVFMLAHVAFASPEATMHDAWFDEATPEATTAEATTAMTMAMAATAFASTAPATLAIRTSQRSARAARSVASRNRLAMRASPVTIINV